MVLLFIIATTSRTTTFGQTLPRPRLTALQSGFPTGRPPVRRAEIRHLRRDRLGNAGAELRERKSRQNIKKNLDSLRTHRALFGASTQLFGVRHGRAPAWDAFLQADDSNVILARHRSRAREY
jgi:hypothetical protein